LSAELTKPHSFRLFFGDFAHWELNNNPVYYLEMKNEF